MHFRNSHRIKYQECQILLSWFVGYRKGLTYSASIVQMLRSSKADFHPSPFWLAVIVLID